MTTSSEIHSSSDQPKAPEYNKRPKKSSALIFLAGVLVGVLVAVGSFFGYQAYEHYRDGQQKPLLVIGTMSLIGSTSWDNLASGCTGSGGYSDIHEGVTVTLSSASGTTIGVTALEKGSKNGSNCMFIWTMRNIPSDEKFYKLEIGHRGVLTYTRQDLEIPLTTSLGGS
ncbi:hypothetical protein ACW9HJ_30875 [Nocardia gipuzkoensis]